MSECPVAVGDVVAGKYRVEGMLGVGGMGSIVLARHLELDRQVAVKFLHNSWAVNTEASERFRREARAAARIRGEHVVQVLDVGSLADGAPFMVMEHLEGHNLATELERRGRIPIQQAADWLIQACRGLAEAHAKGIVHRDLKPENLFLTRRADGSDLIKVMDFGISKSLLPDSASELTLTRTSVIVGSPMYMSPEQLESARQVDVRSDVWSLGVVLYELLSGVMPFPGETIPQLVRSVLTQTRAPLTTQEPGFPHELEAIVARALAFEREHRYQSAWEVAQALKPYASDLGRAAADRVIVVAVGDIRNMPTPLPVPSAALPSPHPTAVGVLPSQRAGHATPSPIASSQPQPMQAIPAASPAPSLGDGHGALAQTNHPNSERQGSSAWPKIAAAVGLVGVLGLGAAAVLKMDPQTASEAASPPPPTVKAPVAAAAPVEILPARLDSFGPLPLRVPGPPGNPTTPEKVKLGQMLFNDPILSQDRDISCSSCHRLSEYGIDRQRTSRGHAGQMGTRNTPSVYNVADAIALMWDGRAETLEEQALLPMANPMEMAITEREAVSRLAAKPTYAKLFALAFPKERHPVTMNNVTKALAAFQRELYTPNSAWDRYLNGDPNALTNEQRAGFNEFVDAGCPTCHFGPDVGLNLFQKAGLVQAWPNARDRGRFEVTGRQADFMVFRVPSLRNIRKTGPYFHDGSVAELEQAVALMGRHQLGVELSPERVNRIVAWLDTLTGEIPTELARAPELP